MKNFRLLLGVALIGALLTYSGCNPDKSVEETPKDAAFKKLKKSWICTAATLNGSAIVLPGANSSYTYVNTLTLAIDGTADAMTYTAGGRPVGQKVTPWRASGGFTFGTDVATTLTRDDAIIVSYSVSDGTAAQLQMSFTTGTSFAGYDRVDNVQGAWVFTFKVQ